MEHSNGTVQNVLPVKNMLARLENVRGISSSISDIVYVDEGDKALLSFTLDGLSTSGVNTKPYSC